MSKTGENRGRTIDIDATNTNSFRNLIRRRSGSARPDALFEFEHFAVLPQLILVFGVLQEH